MYLIARQINHKPYSGLYKVCGTFQIYRCRCKKNCSLYKCSRQHSRISQTKWRHHFSTSEILPEDSLTSSQKLTFKTNRKTLAATILTTAKIIKVDISRRNVNELLSNVIFVNFCCIRCGNVAVNISIGLYLLFHYHLMLLSVEHNKTQQVSTVRKHVESFWRD